MNSKGSESGPWYCKKHLQFCARRSWDLSYFIHIRMGYKPTGPYFTERIEKNNKFFIMCIDSYLVYCVATWSNCRGIITSCWEYEWVS